MYCLVLLCNKQIQAVFILEPETLLPIIGEWIYLFLNGCGWLWQNVCCWALFKKCFPLLFAKGFQLFSGGAPVPLQAPWEAEIQPRETCLGMELQWCKQLYLLIFLLSCGCESTRALLGKPIGSPAYIATINPDFSLFSTYCILSNGTYENPTVAPLLSTYIFKVKRRRKPHLLRSVD